MNTRFMDRLFSATEEKDEELTSQVAKDIEDARANGEVDTEEINYKSNGDGSVSITDKENGEVTVAEQDGEGGYDLFPAQITEQIEGFLHPEGDGVTPGQQEGAPDEHVEDHPVLEEGVVATGANTRMAECEAQEGPCGEKEFSVSTDNSVVLRIFSDQEFCERMFSEVIESEETAKVGDLKIEKIPDEDAVIVTSLETGDQARVDLGDEDMDVTELDSKSFSDNGIDEEVDLGDEQYMPLHVVGIDTFNHQIVDAAEYTEESAQELVEDLVERGVDGVQVFDDPDSARDYAMGLLDQLGVDNEDVEEPVQAEFSDHTIYLTRYFSDSTFYMAKCFSDAVNDVDSSSQEDVEDAIESGEEIETDDEIITPVDAVTAVIEDKETGEYTKAVLQGEDLNMSPISESEADDLMEDIAVGDEKDFSDIWDEYDYDVEEDDRYFSDYEDVYEPEIYCDETETRFFSDLEEEYMTDYMIRLFSEEADQEEIEDAIESGEEIENDDEIITPVDAVTAVIEDKETGEYTKAVVSGDVLDVNPISEDEAEDLMEDIAVEDNDEDEDEKEFSEIYCDEDETRFFSENEEMTDYMIRLFSDEADQDEIESAIESGEQIENDDEIITPVDSVTAVIEDKDSGEFTKATISGEHMNVEAISDEEADELTDGLAVEDEEKTFSNNPVLHKFFSDQVGAGAAQEGEEMIAQGQQMIEEGQALIEQAQQAQMGAGPVVPSIEQVEDKAQAAIQAIQEMTEQAQQAIMEAKEAPVESQQDDLREAQFSEVFTEDSYDPELAENTALNWLTNKLG